MKNKYICFAVLLLLLIGAQSYGQERPLGKTADLLREIRQASGTSAQRTATKLSLSVPAAVLSGKINSRVSGVTGESVMGEIENVANSSFFIRIEGNTLDGHILLRNTKKAYKYYSDEKGNAFVTETDINKLICIEYNKAEERAGSAQRVAAISPALLTLESFPGGNGCVLLDFDGQYVSGTPWNNGNPIDAQPSSFTDAQVQEVWEMVSEDYRPFHVNITTNEAVFNTYSKTRRMRVIFTPTNTAAPGAGGVAYIGSFNWNDDTPCWVFNTGVKGGGEAASHEVGHTFGLGHDGRTSPAEEYYQGQGNWAPIMGVGYYKSIVQWSKGEYANPTRTEDDLAKIASSTYGVGYKADDFGGTTGTAAALGSGTINKSGLIERTGDVDMFSFTTGGGTVTLNFNTAARHPNLDILATLYNSSGGVITTSNPSALTASISSTLSAGTYYVSVTGTGAGNAATDGYSNYASIGLYSITGTVPVGSGVATFYENCDYTGWAVALGEGSYNLADLQARGISNDQISSLKVQSGYKVTLYWDINYAGTTVVKTGDDACLVDDSFNDKATSLVIARNTSAVSTVIEAESYSTMAGVQTETCTDTNGGVNVGYIETGDWMAYNSIVFPATGTYLIEYRVASESGGGRLSLDLNAGTIVLGALDVPSTGGWQTWTTISHSVSVTAGTYALGVYASAGGWNINWIRITQTGAAQLTGAVASGATAQSAAGAETSYFSVYPNPVAGNMLNILSGSDLSKGSVKIVNRLGVEVLSVPGSTSAIDVASLQPGVYTLVFTTSTGTVARHFIKK